MSFPFPFTPDQARDMTNKAFKPAELDQMRSMLDDPNVPEAQRNNFVYILRDAGRLSDADVDKYAPQVGADPSDVKSGGQNILQNMANARKALPGAEAAAHDGQVKREQADVQNAQNALNQGGFADSDQIVDEAEKGLKIFDNYYPLYQQAGGSDSGAMGSSDGSQGPVTDVPAADTSAGAGGVSYSHTGVDPASLRAGLDEFRGIDFNAFHTDAQTLQTAGKSVEQSLALLKASVTAELPSKGTPA